MFKTIERKTNITYYYDDIQKMSLEEIAGWLYDVITSGSIEVLNIDLLDLQRRNDEGSESIQLSAKIDKNNFIQQVTTRSIDVVSIMGNYEKNPIVLNVHLEDNIIHIILRKKKLANIAELAEKLNLNHNNK